MKKTSEHNVYMEPWDGSVVKATNPHRENIPAGKSHDQNVDYCLRHLYHHNHEYILQSDNKIKDWDDLRPRQYVLDTLSLIHI